MMAELSGQTVSRGLEKTDPLSLELTPDAVAFLLGETDLTDEDELRKHILRIQDDAVKVFPYPCIRRFHFTRVKIAELPWYETLLHRAKERDSAVLLDVGCAFGTDIRKLMSDGYAPQNIIACDLRPAFWEIGHKFFRSEPTNFPVKFLQGDLLDPAFVGSDKHHTTDTTLSVYRGRISFIHASSFFHLFTEQEQLTLARTIASLLSPEPGSMILGAHNGRPVKGLRIEAPPPSPGYLGDRMFCHSPESWEKLWRDDVFPGQDVHLEAKLVEKKREANDILDPGVKVHWMQWCVTRL